MATRKQKHEAAIAKRERFFAELRRTNAVALEKERSIRAEKKARAEEDRKRREAKEKAENPKPTPPKARQLTEAELDQKLNAIFSGTPAPDPVMPVFSDGIDLTRSTT